MQDANELPNDLGTAHEVILVQSDSLVKLKEKNQELHTSLEEALAKIAPLGPVLCGGALHAADLLARWATNRSSFLSA